tara:strand:- start:25000 stop:26004 length:1005 start_codon:yes stop_codon:yes gene_type:complete
MSLLEITELQEYFFGNSCGPHHYGPGVCGLILYPNGNERWLNQKMDLMTGQVSFGGPIINKVRELVKKQDKIIFIPFGDEEMFYLMPWWSKAVDNIENNGRKWVRDTPIIDEEKYNIFKKYFDDNILYLTITLYKGKPSFPNVRLIPFDDDIYQHGPYRNILAREIFPEIPYKDKLNKVVWRGGGFTHHINCKHPRLRISKMLENYEWANVKHNDDGWNSKGEHYLHYTENFKYKVNVVIDGVAGASCEKWVFLTGSVVLMISDWTSSVVREMIPWKHFVPVKTDLTDLVENIEWVFNNPEKAEEIAISGKNKFFELTTREYQDKVIKDALEIQ